jgi:hypothetical protein
MPIQREGVDMACTRDQRLKKLQARRGRDGGAREEMARKRRIQADSIRPDQPITHNFYYIYIYIYIYIYSLCIRSPGLPIKQGSLDLKVYFGSVQPQPASPTTAPLPMCAQLPIHSAEPSPKIWDI